MATTSQPRSLLSIARLNTAKSRARPSIWSFVRIDQTCLGRSGGFAPVSLPLFYGTRFGAGGHSLDTAWLYSSARLQRARSMCHRIRYWNQVGFRAFSHMVQCPKRTFANASGITPWSAMRSGWSLFLLLSGRSAASVLRAGVRSTLHGVVFAIFCPALPCTAEGTPCRVRDTRSPGERTKRIPPAPILGLHFPSY